MKKTDEDSKASSKPVPLLSAEVTTTKTKSRVSRKAVSLDPAVGADTDLFGLPRTISNELRKYTQTTSCSLNGIGELAKYLWIRVAPTGSGSPGDSGSRHLTEEEWLNVVDEAASIGVCCLLVCVGDSFGDHPHVWKVCHWAQQAHEMLVGLHTSCKRFSEEDLEALRLLDPDRTCVFVGRQNREAIAVLEEHGIATCSAEVHPDEQSPPCDMPQEMVFVSPEGTLYACGLVLGKNEFRLGSILEKPLGRILNDPTAPRTIPACVPDSEHGCDACPPLMAKRMAKKS